jgi:hypothetical protein
MRYVVTIVTSNREALAAFGASGAEVAAMPTPPAPAMLRARPIGSDAVEVLHYRR